MEQIAAVRTRPDSAQYALGFDEQARRKQSAAQSLGIALGWDYAHHGLTPPVEHLFAQSSLRQGWQAGKATFGRRTLRPNGYTHQWLLLRSYAWSRGRSFEDVQLTPNYLQQIDSDHCPVTRQPLNKLHGDSNEKSIDRVHDDAAYAAGNLALLSRAANQAKGRHDWVSANAIASQLQPDESQDGLDKNQWQRIALLCSFVTELPHARAAVLPLVMLPPNRLRLFNPIQALQVLLTRQFASADWSRRFALIANLLPDGPVTSDFNRFLMALAPRVLGVKDLQSPQQIRWALEDAWLDPLTQKRWAKFALQLTSQQAEKLLASAALKFPCKMKIQQFSQPSATEGWALEQQGFCSPG